MLLSPLLHTGAKPELSLARFAHHVRANWELSCSCSLQTYKISLAQVVCYFGALLWSRSDFYFLKLFVLEDIEFVAPPPRSSNQTLQRLVPGSSEWSYLLLLSLNHTLEFH